MAEEVKKKYYTPEQFAKELEKLTKEYEDRIRTLEAEISADKKVEETENDGIRRENEEYLNQYVAVKLFRDNDKYRDDVYVAVNGQNCVIKRGEWVKIKRKFALVLDQSEIQDMKTAAFLENEQARFAGESAKTGA